VQIDTERLCILPFTLDLIDAAERNDPTMYERLRIVPDREWPEPDLKNALPVFRAEIAREGVTGFGPWIILGRQREIVGSAGFLGKPQDGVVEIGFGILLGKRRNGYCAEAISALINWGRGQPAVRRIIARCEKNNPASRHALAKIGFTLVREDGDLLEWVFAEKNVDSHLKGEGG